MKRKGGEANKRDSTTFSSPSSKHTRRYDQPCRRNAPGPCQEFCLPRSVAYYFLSPFTICLVAFFALCKGVCNVRIVFLHLCPSSLLQLCTFACLDACPSEQRGKTARQGSTDTRNSMKKGKKLSAPSATPPLNWPIQRKEIRVNRIERIGQ